MSEYFIPMHRCLLVEHSRYFLWRLQGTNLCCTWRHQSLCVNVKHLQIGENRKLHSCSYILLCQVFFVITELSNWRCNADFVRHDKMKNWTIVVLPGSLSVIREVSKRCNLDFPGHAKMKNWTESSIKLIGEEVTLGIQTTTLYAMFCYLSIQHNQLSGGHEYVWKILIKGNRTIAPGCGIW